MKHFTLKSNYFSSGINHVVYITIYRHIVTGKATQSKIKYFRNLLQDIRRTIEIHSLNNFKFQILTYINVVNFFYYKNIFKQKLFKDKIVFSNQFLFNKS